MRIGDTATRAWFLDVTEAGGEQADSVEAAVTQVFAAMRDSVYRYLLARVGRPGDAEDLTQEVFLRLYAAVTTNQKIDNLRAWLFRVAHNLSVDWQREHLRSKSETIAGVWSERQEPIDPAPSSEARMLADERATRVAASLHKLSPQERQCLELRVEGLRYREIAEVLGVGISTVQTFLARAVKKLESSSNE